MEQLKTLEELKNYLNKLDSFLLKQPIAVKNGENPAEFIKGVTLLNQRFYYSRFDETATCYTASQMEQMGVLEEFWNFDHEHSAVLFNSETI